MKDNEAKVNEVEDERMDRVFNIDRKVRAASARRTIYGAALAEKLKLRQTDLECLFIMTLDNDVTPGKLARETGLTTGAITGLVDRIERAGYVRRTPDPNDRRRVILVPVHERIAEIRALNYSINTPWLEEMAQLDDAALNIIEDFAERDQAAAIKATLRLRSLT